jgi:hypothetical protein
MKRRIVLRLTFHRRFKPAAVASFVGKDDDTAAPRHIDNRGHVDRRKNTVVRTCPTLFRPQSPEATRIGAPLQLKPQKTGAGAIW